MAGYIRVDTSNNIADGNVISAADLDNEFDGVQAGFNASTGHTHGGAAGEGAPITKLGPAQDVTISTSLMAPKTTNTVDLGSSSLRYKDLFLAGNATIAGTTTLSAALTYGGVTLSNAVTGTGNMVLSASPTLTGTLSGANASLSGTLGVTGVATLGAGAILNTPASVTLTNATGLPISTGVSGLGTGVATALAVNVGSAGAPVLFNGALGTPSSGTVTNLTGTASININGTVGATTANTGAFTTLSATGVSTFQAGTVSAPAITTSGDTNTGIFFPAADTIAFTEGGVEAMRLDSSGNMGVGTSSPAAPLQLGDGTQATREIRTSTLSGSGQGGFLRGYRAGNPSFYVGDSAPISGGSAGGMTLFSYGATSVDTYTNGVLRSTLDSSGNLGLGVTPSAWNSTYNAFDLGGSSVSGRTSTNNQLDLASNGFRNAAGNWVYKYTGGAVRLTVDGSGSGFQWYNAPSGTAGNAISFTQAMTLDASGNLGIGTTSPVSRLNVSGTTGFSWVGSGTSTALATIGTQGTGGSLFVNTASLNSSFASGLGVDGTYSGPSSVVNLKAVGVNSGGGYNSSLAFHTSFETTLTERMRLDSSGNLGLGVTPSAWQSGVPAFESTLGIYSGRTESNLTSNAYFNSGWKYIGTGLATQHQQQAGQHRWFNAASGTAGNAISFTQAMTLNAAGDLLVGTTSANGRITSYSTSDWNLGCVRTGTTTNGHIQFINGNGSVGSITTSGSSTTYVTSSDYRLKENIQPMTGALAKVSTLKPCTYKWKVDGSDGEGFIAHELQAVCPDAVTGEKDAVDAEGNPQYQGIDTSFLVATLTAAIQEQQAIITALTARVAALESN